jgi:hypothetical protein
MKIRPILRFIVWVLVMAGVLVACGGEPTSIPVYITPTAPGTESPQVALVYPTLTSTPPGTAEVSPTPFPTIPPGVTYGPIVGPTQPAVSNETLPTESPTNPPNATYGPITGFSQPTATPPPAESPTNPPDVTYGPIVGPNYTLMPTETHLPPTIPPNATYGPIVGPDYTLMPTEFRPLPTLPPAAPPTAGPSPTALPPLRRDLMGIQIHANVSSQEFNQALARAKDLDVAWVKLQFNWSLLESAPGQYTDLFYILVQYARQAHAEGFKVLISVAKAPGWSRTPDADGIMREDGPPNDPQALAQFLTGMLNKTGLDDQGFPVVDAVEVWNEPNLQREWYGHPLDGGDYMRYFAPAYTAIRQFSPAIQIVTAAPAPTGDSAESTNDRDWLQQLYNAGLAQYGSTVAVGVHPYAWGNPPDARCCINSGRGWDDQPQFFFLDTIEDYHRIMVNNGHTNTQLWATEFGWATFDGLRTNSGTGSQPPDPPDALYFSYVNQSQQATYTIRAFQLAQERPYMGPMILWNLNFSTQPGAVDSSDPQAAYGLVDSQWNPRPVYLLLKQTPKN